MSSLSNKYIDVFINNYVCLFRVFNKNNYKVTIGGLAEFFTDNDHDVEFLISRLNQCGFSVEFNNGRDTVEDIQVNCICGYNGEPDAFEYKIENLMSIISLSSKTDISIVGILVMQIVSRIICKEKVLYKAIVLDLDDTVWKGTLAEDGIDIVRHNLSSKDGASFVAFMRLVRVMARELGLYVAICSRNDQEKVLTAIDKLDEDVFPLKGQIDCVVANYNDKSGNIKAIARKFSILTNACVFIDDNPLVRDEVKNKLPEVFVPDWQTHDELLTILEVCCVFDRLELSLKSRNRKRLYKVLQLERVKTHLPQLFLRANETKNHSDAVRLYAKSNQFKFTDKKVECPCCKSIIFEIYRESGENLGLCSAITYVEDDGGLRILNWAISCRYFEIGLEEYILMYINVLSRGRPVVFNFRNTGYNGKTIDMVNKYNVCFLKGNESDTLLFRPNENSIKNMKLNTNIKVYHDE